MAIEYRCFNQFFSKSNAMEARKVAIFYKKHTNLCQMKEV
jgi:hypothetical protein